MNSGSHSKVSYSDLSEARSDMRRRQSKMSNLTDTKRIKANVYINEMKNLAKYPPKTNYSKDSQSKTATNTSQIGSFIGKKLVKDEATENSSMVDSEELRERIIELQDQYGNHPYIPTAMRTTAQQINDSMLANIAIDCKPREKNFRFYRQDQYEAQMKAPISDLKLFEDGLPSEIGRIQQLVMDTTEREYSQTKLAKYNPKTRLISPFDKIKPGFSEEGAISKRHDHRVSKATNSFGELMDRFNDGDINDVSQPDEESESKEEEETPQPLIPLEVPKHITLMSKYLEKNSKNPQHSIHNTHNNNSIQPDFYRVPINHQLEYILSGDQIHDVANHDLKFANTQGRNLMTALDVSPYARMVQEADLDPKQRGITQGVLRVFTNTNNVKAALLTGKAEINFEEVVTVLHYLANESFFKQVLEGTVGEENNPKQIDLLSSSGSDSDSSKKRKKTTKKQGQGSSKASRINLEESSQLLIPLSGVPLQSRQSKLEDWNHQKMYVPPTLTIQDEKLREAAVKDEIHMRALFQGGKQYTEQKRRLSAEYKRLYIDREHRATQVTQRQIKKETRLDLDDVLKEIEQWKQDRTRLKHLPLNNLAAVQMAVQFDLQYEKVLFKYLQMILDAKGTPSKIELLDLLKEKLANIQKLRSTRHKVRRWTKLIYFFLVEYSKCVKTFREQQQQVELMQEIERRQKLEEQKQNNKSVNQILYELALERQQRDKNLNMNQHQHNRSPLTPQPRKPSPPRNKTPVPKATENILPRSPNGHYWEETSSSALKRKPNLSVSPASKPGQLRIVPFRA